MMPTNPEQEPIDTKNLKESIDLVEFAGQYTRIEQISRTGEFAGPCPQCGGTDRFHVKKDRFYCRKCYPRGGDIIDLVQLIHGLNFKEACQWLSSGSFFFSERQEISSKPVTAQEQPHEGWHSREFQVSAQKTMLATQRLLFSEEGTPGREYLESRGLTEQTWRTYGLGFGRQYHPANRQNKPAIFIPWLSTDGKTITALQHRFIDPGLAKRERYSLKLGSAPILFGSHALSAAEMLVIVEGEVNCMSLHQTGLQALSVGSEANIRNPETLAALLQQLEPYSRIVIWFDQPERADWLVAQMKEHMPFRKEKNLRSIAGRQDANAHLVAGTLQDFWRDMQ